MNRPLAVVALLAGLAVASAATEPAPVTPARRPNLIFIISDDQPTRQFGSYGGAALTPHLDRLARDGLHFTRAHVASSVCTPSRYTCLTGQFASRCTSPVFTAQTTPEGVTRVLWNAGFLPGQPTLAHALRAGGYRTGFVGKWHIGGMDDFSHLVPGSDPADPAVRAALEANQRLFTGVLRGHGFDEAQSIYLGNPNDDRALVNTGLNLHHMEWVTAGALEFIAQADERPFFLYFAPTLTHAPEPAESLEADPRLTPVGRLEQPGAAVQPTRASVIERCRRAGIPRENWGATWLDDGVGALLAKLEERGLLENTLIVYFVDNGMMDHAKGTCYEGGLITPTFAFWPGVVRPAVSAAMIQNTDFAPTLLEVAGVPALPGMRIDGRSFAPLLHGRPYAGREAAYSEIGLVRAVSTAGWKYITFRLPESLAREEATAGRRFYPMGMIPGGSRFERAQYDNGGAWKEHYFEAEQLYDLTADPAESRNLAARPEQAARLAEMRSLLAGFLSDLPGTYPGFVR